MNNARREIFVAATIVLLALLLAFTHSAYFSIRNLTDLLLANLPVLIVSLGMTLVIVAGQIDISVGSQFAVCSIVSGILAKSGFAAVPAALGARAAGFLLGATNGALVGLARIPSIVVTLAAMVGIRDGLRWTTQGAWIDSLPSSFQWLGLSQSIYPITVTLICMALAISIEWGLNNLQAGRAIVAVGSNSEGARLVGFHPPRITLWVFCLSGTLTGLAAALNSARFNQIPSNAGLGLEMKVIAGVVIGGASITGGRGRISGTVLGVILLGMIGPALTFVGVDASWEKALQGAIILMAVVTDALYTRRAWWRGAFAATGN